ncbi:MAG: hypothetical protein FKY71_15125 [Spiribacter salinus]|uniref:Terminase n=1 Tax=Spiribacter salinus TaxID=1335746 RepID=A0A540VN48_9GAMM|nr:MAG: hypothetical protein FKY71_15125 [Spiribacter salinus]
MNIIEAMTDPQLFGDPFAADSFHAHRAVMSAAFGVPMDKDLSTTFKALAGGRQPPAERVRELIVIAGRRSAKTHTAAMTAVYLATIGVELDGTLDRLARGERGVIAVLAVDRNQAKVAFGYIKGLLEGSPILASMIAKIGADSIELRNGVIIEVATNSYRAIRGRTLLAVVFDEAAFWRSDATVNPDLEVYRAAVPALATTGGMLIAISSPYSKRGLIWSKYRKHYGQPGDVLVVQGSTRDFNPTLPAQIITDAMQDDPEAARSEWLGEFRSDIESFIDRALLEALVRDGPAELAPDHRQTYHAFTDPAGGGKDAFTLAIGHMEGDRVIVDVLRDRKGPPGAIVAEYAHLLHLYHCRSVIGDKYAGQWPAQEFSRHDIRYIHADKAKSDLYIETLAAINNRRVELPDSDRLLNQFSMLERKTSRAGRDSIDHPPGGHDDLANAIAGLVATMTQRKRGIDFRPEFTFAI